MKKILMSILVATMILPMMVSADETVYYTNINGATLTEEQYNRLIKVFSEDTIYTMTPKAIDLVKNDDNLKLEETEKYIKIDSYYNRNGELIESIETEVTEEEALNFDDDSQISTFAWNTTHQTSMKKLTMQVVSQGWATHKMVTLTNKWLSIPSTKSYDVIAVRPDSNSMTVNVDSETVSGYQKYDGNYVNYNIGSSNTKMSSSFTGNGGIGISMNIVDSVSSSLENSMTVLFISGADPFKIAGTYQHAQSTVTLAQSQNYTFSSSGLGNVLKFASSVSSKYDGMQGVYLSYNFAEEL